MMAALAVIAACGVQTDEPAPVAVEKIDMPGIINFSRIGQPTGLAGSLVGFGGATQPSAMSLLKNEGFSTVINLRLADEDGADVKGGRTAAETVGLNYIHLPFDPKNLGPDDVEIFLSAAGDKENQPVYIHCGSATRAAALWMVGRVIKDGWEVDTAQQEAKEIAAKPDAAVTLATRIITSMSN